MQKEALMLFYYVIGFVLILLLAYYVTKFIAKKSNNIISGKNTKIIQNIKIDKNNRIMIMMFYSKIYILGVSSNQINLIDKLDAEPNKYNTYNNGKEKCDNFEQYLKAFTTIGDNSNESISIKSKLESIKNRLVKFIKKDDL